MVLGCPVTALHSSLAVSHLHHPTCGCRLPPQPVITGAAFDRVRAWLRSEKPAPAEQGAAGLTQAVEEHVLALVFPQGRCGDSYCFLWEIIPHLCTTRRGVLFLECIAFFKEFIFQLMTGNFSSLFTLREAKAKI